MNRIQAYFVLLLIPAIPSLLMIYSPETIDPVFQYLVRGKGHKYVWVVLLFVLLVSVHFGIVFDAKAIGSKESLIAFTKWYLTAVGIASAFYILVFNTASLQNAYLGAVFAATAFYIYLITFGKKNA